MQAILIKHLTATNTKPFRIKAIANAGTVTICRDGVTLANMTDDEQRIFVAQQLINKLVKDGIWLATTKITGFGRLPNNGDYVATIASK